MPAPLSKPTISTSGPDNSVAAAAARSRASRPLPPATPNSSAAILGIFRARAACALCRSGQRYCGRVRNPLSMHQAYNAEVWVGSQLSGLGRRRASSLGSPLHLARTAFAPVRAARAALVSSRAAPESVRNTGMLDVRRAKRDAAGGERRQEQLAA